MDNIHRKECHGYSCGSGNQEQRRAIRVDRHRRLYKKQCKAITCSYAHPCKHSSKAVQLASAGWARNAWRRELSCLNYSWYTTIFRSTTVLPSCISQIAKHPATIGRCPAAPFIHSDSTFRIATSPTVSTLVPGGHAWLSTARTSDSG